MSAAGMADGHVASDRSAVFEFTEYLGRPLWTAGPEDADGFLGHQRNSRLCDLFGLTVGGADRHARRTETDR